MSNTRDPERDQPLPVDRVAADLAERQAHGLREVRRNGRSRLLDAYEAALDLCAYLAALLMEEEQRATRGDVR